MEARNLQSDLVRHSIRHGDSMSSIFRARDHSVRLLHALLSPAGVTPQSFDPYTEDFNDGKQPEQWRAHIALNGDVARQRTTF